jgi:hypothetical protein
MHYYNTEMFRTLLDPGLGLVGPGLGLGLGLVGLGLGLVGSGLGLGLVGSGLGLVGMVSFNITGDRRLMRCSHAWRLLTRSG